MLAVGSFRQKDRTHLSTAARFPQQTQLPSLAGRVPVAKSLGFALGAGRRASEPPSRPSRSCSASSSTRPDRQVAGLAAAGRLSEFVNGNHPNSTVGAMAVARPVSSRKKRPKIGAFHTLERTALESVPKTRWTGPGFVDSLICPGPVTSWSSAALSLATSCFNFSDLLIVVTHRADANCRGDALFHRGGQ